MPAEISADVKISLSTTRCWRSTPIVGSMDARVSRAPQCVVAALPLSSPAFANNKEPEQTDITPTAFEAALLIRASSSWSLSNFRVPQPPGMTSRSMGGSLRSHILVRRPSLQSHKLVH
jgi:hypothetical protein